MALFPPTVTEIVPVVAPTGTVVVIVVDVLAVTMAVVPLKLTVLLAGVRSKFVPVIVTVVPMGPEAGVKAVMVGTAAKVNPFCVAVPPGVVTETLPEVPAAIIAVILVADTTLNDAAAVPPKLTAVAPVKFVPVIVTVVPMVPEAGVKDVISGSGKVPK